jgi:hypothetical protein
MSVLLICSSCGEEVYEVDLRACTECELECCGNCATDGICSYCYADILCADYNNEPEDTDEEEE